MEENNRLTFRDLDSLDRLIVNSSSASLNKLVPFNTDIDDFGPLDRQLNQLFHHIADDVGSGLEIGKLAIDGTDLPATLFTLYFVRSSAVLTSGFTSAGFSVSDMMGVVYVEAVGSLVSFRVSCNDHVAGRVLPQQ